jgi:hypothetical protein
MSLLSANDESLVHLYESVRLQVQADSKSGGQFRFMGEAAKQYSISFAKKCTGDG